MKDAFTPSEKAAVYRAIYERRDMRHFRESTVPEDTLLRVLSAAHAAPSVGLMQPWRIIRISDQAVRQRILRLVERERIHTAHALGERKDEFMRLKVEGINDCAELLVVTLSDKRDTYIFGRRTLPEMDVASVACAIQNMWLAARAENLGMGWVSIFEPRALSELLKLPKDAYPLAILCLGEVEAFYDKPMLEKTGWAKANTLDDVLMENSWDPDKAASAHRK